MKQPVKFADAFLFGFRAMRWRPMHAGIYIAVVTILYFLFYAWAGSESGQAFYQGYFESNLALQNQQFDQIGVEIPLLFLVSSLANVLIVAGAVRLLVRRDTSPYWPLQMGGDELRTLGLMVAIVLILVAALIVGMLGISLILVVLGAVLSVVAGSQGGVVLASVLGVIGGIVLLVAMLVLVGRLWVSIPLSIIRRRFSMGGWEASKGDGWTLLGAHIAIYAIILGMALLSLPSLMAAATDPSLAEDPAAMAEMVARPLGALTWVLTPINVALMVVLAGPTAAVAWNASQARDDIADVF